MSNLNTFLLCSLFIVFNPTSLADETDIFNIGPGHCSNDAEGTNPEEDEELETISTVSCDGPHDNEFYSAFNIIDELYPGEAAIFAYADEECANNFESFVGIPYNDSILELSYLFPTYESWLDGDNEVVCFLYHPDFEKLEGSMEGKKI